MPQSSTLFQKLKATSRLKRLRQEVQRIGAGRAVYRLFYALAERALGLAVFEVLLLRRDDFQRIAVTEPKNVICRQLDQSECLSLSGDAQLEMTANFVNQEIKKGDHCFAVFVNDILANYGSRANISTLLTPQLKLNFREDQMYMYKGFTLPAYRGHRLHAFNRVFTFNRLSSDSINKAITLVESYNDASLKSLSRIGFKYIGRIIKIAFLGKVFVYNSQSCRKFGIRIGST